MSIGDFIIVTMVITGILSTFGTMLYLGHTIDKIERRLRMVENDKQ